MLMGLLAGGMTLAVAAVFPEELSFTFFAVVLALTAGTYPGLAMAEPQAGRPLLEWIAAIGFTLFGMVGLWFSPLILAGAWALHALWSLLHRATSLGDAVPEGYAGACFFYALLLSGFVAYMWAAALAGG